MKQICLLSSVVTLFLLAQAPALADSACLGAAGIQEALVAGQALRLADISHKLRGDIVKADLCHRDGKLAYRVTILTSEGTVRRVTVDARSGELVYGDH